MKRKVVWLSLFLMMMTGLFLQTVGAEETIVITSQPQNQIISYPNGTSFSVAVEDPSAIASYQWIARNPAGEEFVLDGRSASTDTLIIPSTRQSQAGMEFFCILTDHKGNQTRSDAATLMIGNSASDKTVIYVGDYALQMGETLDLSDTTLGSGVISFLKDDTTIILENVQFNNSEMTFDHRFSPAIGFAMVRSNPIDENYTVTINGNNKFVNTYVDEKTGYRGNTFDFIFTDVKLKKNPEVFFKGDGTLTVQGGSTYFRADGSLLFDCFVTTDFFGDNTVNGIIAENVSIVENAYIELIVKGTAIRCSGNLDVYDSSLIVSSFAPYTEGTPTMQNVISLLGSGTFVSSHVLISSRVEAASFVPYDGKLAYCNAIAILEDGNLIFMDTFCLISMSTSNNSDLQAVNFNGIFIENDSSAIMIQHDSNISIEIITPQVDFVHGIDCHGDFELQDHCVLNIDIQAYKEIVGANIDGYFSTNESQTTVNVDSLSEDTCIGILCGSFSAYTDSNFYDMKVKADNGIALAVTTGLTSEVPVNFAPNYNNDKINIAASLECYLPAHYTISGGSLPSYKRYDTIVTIYDDNNHSAPAEEIRIAAEENISTAYEYGSSIFFCLIMIYLYIHYFSGIPKLFNKTRKKKHADQLV